MANPFYVEPGMNLGPGLMQLGGLLEAKKEARLKKAQEEQMMATRKQAGQILSTGTPEEISAFAAENPWIADEMSKAIGFKNELTKQNAIESARKILIGGESPTKVLTDRAETVMNEGGDPSGTIQLAQAEVNNPGVAKKEAEKILALYAPDEYNAYAKATGQGSAVGQKPTAAIQNLEYLESLPEGPAKDRFAKMLNVSDEKGKLDEIKLMQAKADLRAATAKEEENQMKREDKINLAKTNVDESLSQTDEAVKFIDEALDLAKNQWATGYANLALGQLPETLARQLNSKLDIIKSKNALETISRMKSQSRTGATGFGALSAPELDIIQKNITDLDPLLGSKVLVKNLEDLKKRYQGVSGKLNTSLERLVKQSGSLPQRQQEQPAEQQQTAQSKQQPVGEPTATPLPENLSPQAATEFLGFRMTGYTNIPSDVTPQAVFDTMKLYPDRSFESIMQMVGAVPQGQ